MRKSSLVKSLHAAALIVAGILFSGVALADRNGAPSESEVREWLEGNLCRCTGYHNIVKSVQAAAQNMGG